MFYMNNKVTFKPHTNHWSFNGFREKVTRKQLQELIMSGVPASRKLTIKNGVFINGIEQEEVKECFAHWMYKHIGVGIYYLWIDGCFAHNPPDTFMIKEVKA
jgi:hypothetical protein